MQLSSSYIKVGKTSKTKEKKREWEGEGERERGINEKLERKRDRARI